MTETILKRIIHVCFFAVLLVPFIVAGSMFFPYITGKAFVFRALVDVMFVSWACLAFVNKAYRPRWTPIMVAMGAFIAVVGVANIVGENPERSFWSNFERMEGFVMLMHVALYLLVVGATIVHEKVWSLFLNLSLVVSATLAVGGLFEVLREAGDVRIDGTFGNSTYFAVYLLFNVFIALVFAYRSRHQSRMAALYGGAATLLAIALYYTGTRGAILGIVAGLSVAALTMLVRGGARHPRARRVSAVFLVLVVAAAALFFLFRESQFVQNQRTLERIANISFTDQTTQSRLTLWSSIGWKGFVERPILGWGQDNFIVVFGKYYDPIMYKQEPWFDRAHNVFVDWAIAGGLLGLVSYGALFVAALWMIFRSGMSLPEKALFVGLISAYGVHNLFVFDNLVSYIYFATILGYIHTRGHTQESIPVGSPLPLSALAGVGLVASVVFVGVNGVAIVRAQTLVDAIRVHRDTQDPAQVLPLFEKALGGEWGTGVQESREHLSQTAAALVRIPNIDRDAQRAFMARALEEASEEALEEPNNTRSLYFFAQSLRVFGQPEESRAVLDQALAINPYRQNFLYEYGNTYLDEGRFEEALEYFERAYTIEPENETAFMFYVATLVYAGQGAAADALMLERFGTVVVDNDILINAYKKTGRTDRVIDVILLRLATTSPMEPQEEATLRISLVPLYVDRGNRAEALEQTRKAIELYPPFAEQGEQMIKAIQAGQRVQVTI